MIRSSYLNSVNYRDIFSTLMFGKKFNSIVEIGILDGFSLQSIVNNIDSSCTINAYDIFEEFNGNHAESSKVIEMFKEYDNVHIDYGNFYELYKTIPDNSLDMLHIDIANDGNIYNYVIENYMQKLKKDGILIMEGGSIERDNVEWMIKYDKEPIYPIVNNLKDKYDICTVGNVPSITIIKQKNY